METLSGIKFDDQGNPIIKRRFPDGRRTPGPYTPDEVGPVVDDIVVQPNTTYYKGGTVPRRSGNGVKFPRSLDDGEVGTAQNDYTSNG